MTTQQILHDIQLVVFDFDGVFTNNKVIVSDAGSESVICDRSDGLGLSMIRSLGIKMLILSTETNPVVSHRANKLGLECIQGINDKLKKLIELSKERRISLDNTAFVGNDINDLDCLKAVGLPVVVADAYPQAKEAAKMILTHNGGEGAVREFCEWLFENQKPEIL
jgi:YrbI family 3-deoxy-D-manno-octulosonate 8-phosphate phosphatase